jgi:hypothetical protein
MLDTVVGAVLVLVILIFYWERHVVNKHIELQVVVNAIKKPEEGLSEGAIMSRGLIEGCGRKTILV